MPSNDDVFKRKFFEFCSEFSHRIEIYTDGSKDGIRTAAAVVARCCCTNSVKTVRLPDNASNFTAEINALNMALDIIRRTIKKQRLCGFLGLLVQLTSNRELQSRKSTDLKDPEGSQPTN